MGDVVAVPLILVVLILCMVLGERGMMGWWCLTGEHDVSDRLSLMRSIITVHRGRLTLSGLSC